MSDANPRTQVHGRLRDLSERMPETRCPQLIAAVGEPCANLHARGRWVPTDPQLLKPIRQFRRNDESATARSR